MLKALDLVKSAEVLADEALRLLLGKIPAIQIQDIERNTANGHGEPDLVVRLLVEGQLHLLICDYKPNGQPRYARSALLELNDYAMRRTPHATPTILVFMAPYISPAVRQLCVEKNVGYLDLAGNARIAFGGVYIERAVAEKPASEQRALKSLFKPKSARVLRAMLRDPYRAWRVTELATVSGVSVGHVSNVRSGLIDREWACASAAGLFLSQPDALLDAWRDSYAAPAGERMRFYTPLHGAALENAVSGSLGAHGGPGQTALASFSAAQWLAPYARVGAHYFFVDREGLQKLRDALKIEPSAKGENVVVTVPKDAELLIDTVEPAPGVICTSPIQTYLDLSIAGDRGMEAAEHLRREKLTWT
ncbi:MAG: hypothetical protein FWG56_02405 [Desulfovibrionaceae bacterium]|nr:hypothetical protein [Desulfovibrionaceae bacterium]